MPELPLIRLEKLPPLSGSGKITFPALDEAAGSFSHRGGASTFPTGFHLVFPPVKQACVRESGKRSRPVRQVIFFFPPAGAQCDSGLLVSKCCSSGRNYRLSVISSATSLATAPPRRPTSPGLRVAARLRLAVQRSKVGGAKVHGDGCSCFCAAKGKGHSF